MKLLSIVLGLISVALAATNYQTDDFSIDQVENQLLKFPYKCGKGKYAFAVRGRGYCQYHKKGTKRISG